MSNGVDYDEFFERYYHDEILELAGDNPDRQTLIIDFNHLQSFNREAADALLEHPDMELENLRTALQEYPAGGSYLEGTTVSIRNLPDTEKVSVGRVGSANISRLVAVEGRLNKVGPVRSKLIEGAFKCQRCGHVTRIAQPDERYIEPFECGSDDCGRKGPFKLIPEELVWKDELSGGYAAQAGALVLADKGLFIADEFDKLTDQDKQALNTALESGKIDIHKGGLNQTFNTRCPVIALLNPKGIRFDDSEPLAGQVGVPADTLSRFDLVFLLQDKPKPDSDRKIAEHQILAWTASPGEKIAPFIPTDTIRKYLIYAKTFDPVIPDDVASAIVEYFLSIRSSANGAVSATFRENNGIARLVKCMAKLQLSNKCTMGDLELAKWLYDRVRISITDPVNGMQDIDALTGAPTKSQRDRMKAIREIIQTLQGNDAAFFDEIASSAKVKGIAFDHLTDILKHFKSEGDIIEVRNNFYRWVD